MGEKVGCIKLLLWIGIVLFFVWFMIFSINPESVLTALSLTETHGFFLRIYGIFQLSWALLLLFALKDVEKNIAIINAAVITGALIVISIFIYYFMGTTTDLWQLLCAAVIFVYTLLLFLAKPKAA
jgi:hypothetical protein